MKNIWKSRTEDERRNIIMKRQKTMKSNSLTYNGNIKTNKHGGFVAYAHPDWTVNNKRYIGSFPTQKDAVNAILALKSTYLEKIKNQPVSESVTRI